MSDGPVLTRRLTMHLNSGGSSRLVFAILADGEETGITRIQDTGGRPKYPITDDVLCCGEETFDVLEARGVGMKEWILAHIKGPGDESEARP